VRQIFTRHRHRGKQAKEGRQFPKYQAVHQVYP
jgi:hypothetical protein